MAEARKEQKFGCTAWLEVIRGSVNERLTKARNSLHRRRDSEKKKSLTPLIQMTGAGSGDLVVARNQRLSPRPATIDMKEEIKYLRVMISEFLTSLDTTHKWYADIPHTVIDVDRVVDDILRKVSEECLHELQSSTCCLVGSPLFTSPCTSIRDSASVTSSQISFDLVVDDMLRKVSDECLVELQSSTCCLVGSPLFTPPCTTIRDSASVTSSQISSSLVTTDKWYADVPHTVFDVDLVVDDMLRKVSDECLVELQSSTCCLVGSPLFTSSCTSIRDSASVTSSQISSSLDTTDKRYADDPHTEFDVDLVVDDILRKVSEEYLVELQSSTCSVVGSPLFTSSCTSIMDSASVTSSQISSSLDTTEKRYADVPHTEFDVDLVVDDILRKVSEEYLVKLQSSTCSLVGSPLFTSSCTSIKDSASVTFSQISSSLDTNEKRYADVPHTEFDVDLVVDDILRKVSEEYLVELQSSTCSLVGSPLFTSSCISIKDSASVTSSQISYYAETLVEKSLTRLVSETDVQLDVDVDMTFGCKQIGNELYPGAVYAELGLVASLDTTEKRYADVPHTEFDVDLVVDDILRKVSEEYLVELKSSTCSLVGSPLFTSSCTSIKDSASVTSSQISYYAETLVEKSLTRLVSETDVQLDVDVDMTFGYKQIGNELYPGAVYAELGLVAFAE